jgi:hypothetical protein
MTEGLGSYKVAIDEHHSAAKRTGLRFQGDSLVGQSGRLGAVRHRESDQEYETKDDPYLVCVLSGFQSPMPKRQWPTACGDRMDPQQPIYVAGGTFYVLRRQGSRSRRGGLATGASCPTNRITPRVLETSSLSWEMKESQMPPG